MEIEKNRVIEVEGIVLREDIEVVVGIKYSSFLVNPIPYAGLCEFILKQEGMSKVGRVKLWNGNQRIRKRIGSLHRRIITFGYCNSEMASTYFLQLYLFALRCEFIPTLEYPLT